MLSQLFYHPMMEAKVALLLPSRGGNSFHCQCKLPGLNNILAIICSTHFMITYIIIPPREDGPHRLPFINYLIEDQSLVGMASY